MRTVNIATLKAKLSEYLRLAQSGETIKILDRRRPIAELSGIHLTDDQQMAHDLVRTGRAEWHGGKPEVKPIKLRKGPANIADAVLEDRG
jgi:antitoxin (DNA-binding transcriptional repressor) of toxin-antitoxin stability system